jgi:hypothetical protein
MQTSRPLQLTLEGTPLSTDSVTPEDFNADLKDWVKQVTGKKVPPRPSTSAWHRLVASNKLMTLPNLNEVVDSCLERSGFTESRAVAIRNEWLERWMRVNRQASADGRTTRPRSQPSGFTRVDVGLDVAPPPPAADQRVPALPLGDPQITAERFGLKAAVLSQIEQRRLAKVPAGWCVLLNTRDADKQGLSRALDQAWGRLSAPGSLLVVRSSASVEDSPTALFAGRFKSVSNVQSRHALHVAVEEVRESADDVAVNDYIESLALPQGRIRMSVLIQQQIAAKFAGAAQTKCPARYAEFDMYVEFRDGPSGPQLAGDEIPAAYGLKWSDSAGFDSTHLLGPEYDSRDIARFLPLVFDTCKKVAQSLGSEQEIEWVWDGDELWIVQARSWSPPPPSRTASAVPPSRFPVAGETTSSTPELKSLKNSKNWGLKGAAEAYFTDRLHCGAPNCTLILPYDEAGEISKALSERVEGPDGTTIRFSFRAEVGVPRIFVPPGGDVLGTFLRRRESPEWMGIVSDYLYIRSSFEAYISASSLLVEHVPGNWETENELLPDLFLFTRERCEVYRVTDYRLAKIEAPGNGASHSVLRQKFPPLSADQASAWARQFVEHFRKIQADMKADLPLNVHFISDPKDNFYFLNIRPTRNIDISKHRDASRGYKSNRMFRVESRADVDSWDHVARIVVDAVADRGDEERIAGVAMALREAGATTVYCRFGLLSHPAIVLRECGLEVVPLHEKHDVQRLDDVHW